MNNEINIAAGIGGSLIIGCCLCGLRKLSNLSNRVNSEESRDVEMSQTPSYSTQPKMASQLVFESNYQV